jgi:hypothetical protein
VHIKRRLSGRATAHNIREYCGRRGLTVRFPVLSHLLLFAPPLSIGTPTDSNISGTCVQYKAPFGAISGPPHTTPCNVCHVWWLCPESQITQLRGVVFLFVCVFGDSLCPHMRIHSLHFAFGIAIAAAAATTHVACVCVCLLLLVGWSKTGAIFGDLGADLGHEKK